MSFNAMPENKILAKVSESPEYVLGNQRYLEKLFYSLLIMQCQIYCTIRFLQTKIANSDDPDRSYEVENFFCLWY